MEQVLESSRANTPGQSRESFYHAGFYLRLSREEKDKAESDSIAGQRSLLTEYLSAHPEIRLHKVWVDDGYSGVNFQRPGFQKMMEAVREGEADCIIVKDFSRLGRNFIEVGKYIEKIFPFLGVRFISVNDGYDSINPWTASDHLMVPVKNLIKGIGCLRSGFTRYLQIWQNRQPPLHRSLT